MQPNSQIAIKTLKLGVVFKQVVCAKFELGALLRLMQERVIGITPSSFLARFSPSYISREQGSNADEEGGEQHKPIGSLHPGLLIDSPGIDLYS